MSDNRILIKLWYLLIKYYPTIINYIDEKNWQITKLQNAYTVTLPASLLLITLPHPIWIATPTMYFFVTVLPITALTTFCTITYSMFHLSSRPGVGQLRLASYMQLFGYVPSRKFTDSWKSKSCPSQQFKNY